MINFKKYIEKVKESVFSQINKINKTLNINIFQLPNATNAINFKFMFSIEIIASDG